MDGNAAGVRIRGISDPGELKIVEELAWKIFPATYAGLIPAEQIPYMMRRMYDDAVLREEFSRGCKFDLILADGVPVGYVSWHFSEYDGAKIVRLEKLYLDFAFHGRSIGNLGLRHVLAAAKRAGASFVSLNVNKWNLRAQKAYLRAGFYRWRSEKEDVGGGFFKDDYVMRCDVHPRWPVAPFGFVRVADVVPGVRPDLRYCTADNFAGERIDGYEAPVALLTVAAAEALGHVAAEVGEAGYGLKIYDAYRPVRAVAHFMRWARDLSDTRTRARFYPELDKAELIPGGYIAEKSAHSRGGTVDLTLCDLSTGEEADMGGSFDRFGKSSHPDWCGDPETGEYTGGFPGDAPAAGGGINETQFRNRMRLRRAMLNHGFAPIAAEWWHFTLKEEPYPDTYFDFPVR